MNDTGNPNCPDCGEKMEQMLTLEAALEILEHNCVLSRMVENDEFGCYTEPFALLIEAAELNLRMRTM